MYDLVIWLYDFVQFFGDLTFLAYPIIPKFEVSTRITNIPLSWNFWQFSHSLRHWVLLQQHKTLPQFYVFVLTFEFFNITSGTKLQLIFSPGMFYHPFLHCRLSVTYIMPCHKLRKSSQRASGLPWGWTTCE